MDLFRRPFSKTLGPTSAGAATYAGPGPTSQAEAAGGGATVADARAAKIDARRTRQAEREREITERRAYERGRRDEHARRRGHPVLAALLVLAAGAGAFVVYLAVREGSFTSAGQVIDHHVAAAAQTGDGAAAKAGDALQNAGARLKQTAGSSS